MSFKNLDLSAVSLNSKIENTSHRQYCRATQELYSDIWVYGAILELKNKVIGPNHVDGTYRTVLVRTYKYREKDPTKRATHRPYSTRLVGEVKIHALDGWSDSSVPYVVTTV